ncbi:MAG: AcrB/AcrD/AcrF family protein [Rickettsiaceae bacterium]|jgi:HAE1 family hydrophobic/amphiphilic exporter-1|nr:AcrB/AcrD/AcrF family protein [Rickettsiaceae bacterium]
MNLPSFSIKHPAFITSIMTLIITVGVISFNKMSVDLFPDIDIPTVFVSTTYSGAGPRQIETAVTKPLEDEISTIAGIKKLTSRSLQDTSQVIINFYQGTDMKYAEQQVRDKINQAKPRLPEDIIEPIIRRIDPSDQPIMTISIDADLPEGKLFDLADNYIKPRLEQVSGVGLVEILGSRKREIQVLLDQNILKNREITYGQIRQQIQASGQNVPIGKNDFTDKEIIFSSDSEFSDVDKIKNILVNFYSNEIPTKIINLGSVEDTLEDETTKAFVNGKKALFLNIYRQSDSNIIAVSRDVKKQISKMEDAFTKMDGKPHIESFKDASRYIEMNIDDIYHTITLAVILTVITVFFFLANGRATLITAISLPIALISSFILMYIADFSINVISLLAMSLAVGLLVDDAIVVVENIYRKIESGQSPKEAAVSGTMEILMAVVAITLVVVAVFTPVSFMKGVVGQYLKQFGLTIAFSMLVSLFIAITIIPVLCAYLASKSRKHVSSGEGQNTTFISKLLKKFDQLQIKMENKYEKILIYSIAYPRKIILITIAICALSIVAAKYVPKTFINESDTGEVTVGIELEAESSLKKTNQTIQEIDQIIRQNKEVLLTASTVGTRSSQSNRGEIYVKLKQKRDINTSDFKQKIRDQLKKDFSNANPVVKDYDPSGGASRSQPFNIGLVSNNPELLENYSAKLLEKLRQNPNLKDVDSSNKSTRTELKIILKPNASKLYGINDKMMGDELRGYIEGYVVGKLRQDGYEYDVRARLKDSQRDLKANFNNFYVTNVNNKLIKLSDIANLVESKEAARIDRQDRGRYIQITSGLAPKAGLGNVIAEVEKIFAEGDLKLPSEIRYSFSGDSENMQDMLDSMKFALFISILFIYLILASLYESFVTPFTILLALPFAFCGVFFGLLITGESISIFTILGVFMLVAVAGKNSILLVDFTNHLIEQGKSRSEALIAAGKIRLRPILMTSFALIAGTLPVAIGLNEVSKPRSGMGVAIISGLISSTILTLVVVPAVFSYIDRFRVWAKNRMANIIIKDQ